MPFYKEETQLKFLWEGCWPVDSDLPKCTACGVREEWPTLVKALMVWAKTASSTSNGSVLRLTMQCSTQRMVWCWPWFCRKKNQTSYFKNFSRNQLRATFRICFASKYSLILSKAEWVTKKEPVFATVFVGFKRCLDNRSRRSRPQLPNLTLLVRGRLGIGVEVKERRESGIGVGGSWHWQWDWY